MPLAPRFPVLRLAVFELITRSGGERPTEVYALRWCAELLPRLLQPTWLVRMLLGRLLKALDA